MKHFLIYLAIISMAILSCGQPAEIPYNDHYIPVKGSAWRLAIADVTSDGKNELIYGAYDGAVRCQDITTGNIIWELP